MVNRNAGVAAPPLLPSLNLGVSQLWSAHYTAQGADRTRPARDARVATLLRAVYSRRQVFAGCSAAIAALAFAAGEANTRSHFDAMHYIETAALGSRAGAGWLTCYLESWALPSGAPLPALAAGAARPASLIGYPDAVSMYGSSANWLDRAGLEAIDAIRLIQSQGIGAYAPSNGAIYPSGSFGANLKLIAQMIKAGVGLAAATVDLGGRDTHENQGVAVNSAMGALLGTLARGLEAFHTDLKACGGATDYNAGTVVAVMSEFGRRLKENANAGTGHGHGGVILLVGKPVNGGRVYGQWPGLSNEQLYQRADLAVTTDYRRVLSEWLRVRAGRSEAHLGAIFPGYAQQAGLGLFRSDASPLPASCITPPSGLTS